MFITRNLKKTFKIKERKHFFGSAITKEIIAVKDASIEINPGQIVGLLGVNGAGKTTTIRMLSGLLEPTSGSITINGKDGVKDPIFIKKMVNVINGGERNIYWRLTAKENLEYFGALYNISNQELRARTDHLIKMVGLNDVMNMPVERFSKGMKQRLQIARGLINDPDYLLLDEPTLGLDISIARELRSSIKNLAKQNKKGILLTSHYISEVEELCDYIFVMNKGEIIAKGTPKEITYTNQSKVEFTVTLPELPEPAEEAIRLISLAHEATTEIGMEENNVVVRVRAQENLTPYIVKTITEFGLPIIQLTTSQPRLEDALLKLASGGGKIEQNISNF